MQQFGFIFPTGWYEVCKIEFSHMGKNNGNPDLVCKKIVVIKDKSLLTLPTVDDRALKIDNESLKEI